MASDKQQNVLGFSPCIVFSHPSRGGFLDTREAATPMQPTQPAQLWSKSCRSSEGIMVARKQARNRDPWTILDLHNHHARRKLDETGD